MLNDHLLPKEPKICIVGLGYVGLPLAIEFSKNFKTIGFDISIKRINELKAGKDITLEVETEYLEELDQLLFTSDIEDIQSSDIFIVTVPTPVDENKKPDLIPLVEASKLIGKVLKPNNLVIYESTVFPGATEEICAPILSEISNLNLNKDFFLGYSPERINPGDKQHTITNITKVTSGSTQEVAEYVDSLYQTIISAGTFKASSIKVAEAAKVIENTQRDINIALINELSIIFDKLNIDSLEVLEAASTKWNFLPFRPGLVGGHCIGVDPYYLTYKAQEAGYSPEVILAGRRINDNMGHFISNQVVKLMKVKEIEIQNSRILVLGLAFKENCPDIRNTRVIDIVNELKKHNMNIDIYDPWVEEKYANKEFDIEIIQELKEDTYDAIVVAVAHDKFKEIGAKKIKELGKKNCIIYDVKGILPKEEIDGRL